MRGSTPRRPGPLFPALYFTAAACVLAAFTSRASRADEVSAVLNAYVASVNTVRKQPLPAEEDKQWTEDWLRRLTTVAAENPHSPNHVRALIAAVPLANSSANWKESKRLIGQLLIVYKDDAINQFEWYTELGEVTQMLSYQTNLDDDRASAVDAFQKANALAEKLAKDVPGHVARQEQRILNLAWISELYGMSEPRDRAAHSRAAVSFRDTRRQLDQFISDYGPPEHRLRIARWDSAALTRNEIVESLRGEDYEHALQALKFFSSISGTEQPASSYVDQASRRLPVEALSDRAGYRECLRTWLGIAPADDWTCRVKFLLAEAFYHDDRFDEAQPIYEDLRDHYFDAFNKLEPKALAEGAGGTYSFVLDRLRDIYRRAGDDELAEKTNQRFIELYPNYGAMTDNAKTIATHIDENRRYELGARTKPATSAWAGRWWLIAANAALVFALIGGVALLIHFGKSRRP